MKIYRIRILITGIILSCLMMPMTISAHEATDTLHSIPIEAVGSSLANLTNIHVQVTDQGVAVKGKLKRKGHKSRSLRGHVDVELVGVNGHVLESKKIDISRHSGSVKHDHARDFSGVLPSPKGKEYSVRVRHNVGMDDHERAE